MPSMGYHKQEAPVAVAWLPELLACDRLRVFLSYDYFLRVLPLAIGGVDHVDAGGEVEAILSAVDREAAYLRAA